MTNKFNEKSATFQVNSLVVTDVAPKLLTAIAGGTAPEVVVGGSVPYAELWARHAVLPLDDYLKSSKVIQPEDFFESNWKRARWKGATYGVPAIEAFVSFGFGWNEELIQKAGLSGDKPPTTFDELFEWHTKLTSFDQAKNLRVLGFDPGDAVSGSVFFWTRSHGVEYWDAANLKYNLDNPETAEAFATMKKFYDHVGAEKIDGFRKSYGQWTQSPTAAFPTGVSATIVNGYWQPGELTKSGRARSSAQLGACLDEEEGRQDPVRGRPLHLQPRNEPRRVGSSSRSTSRPTRRSRPFSSRPAGSAPRSRTWPRWTRRSIPGSTSSSSRRPRRPR